ncbi:uncharacterized protein PAC_09900 [Phialocephala subalpina]|uniref:Uncharacterized protein n=1 Tax=Phialocephala subalpina TaxID=576137 RepID=A0A1L7X4Q7_9HELO|nr:uncharacterized protein PAC_09900 [Phialocephala subalpina]
MSTPSPIKTGRRADEEQAKEQARSPGEKHSTQACPLHKTKLAHRSPLPLPPPPAPAPAPVDQSSNSGDGSLPAQKPIERTESSMPLAAASPTGFTLHASSGTHEDTTLALLLTVPINTFPPHPSKAVHDPQTGHNQTSFAVHLSSSSPPLLFPLYLITYLLFIRLAPSNSNVDSAVASSLRHRCSQQQ